MPWSRNTTWRQGSVLAKKDFQAVGLTDVPDADLAIAISHDCDIANDNLDIEPVVEFIYACILNQRNGNYTHGKNPRTLHLDYTHGENLVVLELLASKKLILQKIGLRQFSLMSLIDSLIPSRFFRVGWQLDIVAMLYRTALLIGFVKFSHTLRRKAKTILLESCLSVYLNDPEDELPPKEPYELWLNVVYISDKDEYHKISEDIAQSLKTEFPNLLEKTKDYGTVILRKCDAVSEMEFTLRDLRDTVEYHLEHLSYRTKPSGPVI